MRAKLAQIGAGVRTLSLCVFALWLGGVGCLFCCQGAAAPVAKLAEMHAQLAPPASHACCKARATAHTSADSRSNGGNNFAPLRATDLTRQACPLDPMLVADAARRPRAPAQAPASTIALLPALHVVAFGRTPVARSRLPDGRATYLRLAVFLI
jgi:hypothetical protein